MKLDVLPDDVLIHIGHVTVNAVFLGQQLCNFAAMVMSTDPWDILGKPGGSVNAAREALGLLSANDRRIFETWVRDALDLLQERHAAVHVLWGLGPLSDDGITRRYAAFHLKTGKVQLFDPPSLHRLARRLMEHAERGMDLLDSETRVP
jgi:hypothetical protein